MSKESEFLENARKASIKAQVEKLRLIQRLKERAADAADGEVGGKPSATGASSFPLGDLVFDLARLHVNSYSELLDVRAKYTDKVIDILYGQRPTRPAPTVRPVLSFSGTTGSDAGGEFSVE